MNLLIVEDDKVLAILIQRIFAPHIRRVFVTSKMEEAERFLEENKEDPPNVVTLDLNLEDCDWRTTLSKIRKFKVIPETLVVVVSGVRGIENLEEMARAAGADNFLKKDDKLFRSNSFLQNFRDTIESLTMTPQRYTSWHANLLNSINRRLELEQQQQQLPTQEPA